jgi:PleD family two-component response regulator
LPFRLAARELAAQWSCSGVRLPREIGNAALKKRDQYETVHKPRRWLAMKKGPIDAAPVVLVVDDEPLIRIFTVQVLADAGYEVDEAGNSDEALQRLNGRLIKG